MLEKGRYTLYLGNSVRDTQELAWAYEQEETQVIQQLSGVLAPSRLPKRLLADGSYEDLPAAQEVP